MGTYNHFKDRGSVYNKEGPFAWESHNRNVKWNLDSLIEAATHTEDKVKAKLLEYASEEVKQRYADSTLDEILSLPPEVQMDIDYSKKIDIDELVEKVKTTLIYFINKRITNIVDFIKQKQFTPFEAMIYIHNYVTSLQYTRGDASQIIVGALNGQEIVCSGYASIIKAIIDKLNMPGLKCDIIGLNKINEDKTGYADIQLYHYCCR